MSIFEDVNRETECLRRCMTTQNCKWFSHNSDLESCFLFESCDTMTEIPSPMNYKSGPAESLWFQ